MLYDRGNTMKRTTMAALHGVLALSVSAVIFIGADAYAGNSNFDSNNGSQSVSGAGNSQNVTGNNSTGLYSNSSSTSSASSGTVTSSGNSTTTVNEVSNTPSTETIKSVPTVYAPGLSAAGSEVCLGSLSAGGSAVGWGLTVGGTMVDRECQLRLNAKTLAILGYTVAAREEMCLDPEVRAALAAAGTPCAADKNAPPQARAEYTSAVPQTYAAAPPPAPPGCHKQYQLLGGWYDVCPANAEPTYATAQVSPAEAAAPVQDVAASAPEGAAPGCHKEYQLIGGWYDKCD